MYKLYLKASLIFSILLISLNPIYSRTLLNESQARNYITHLIDNLFITPNHSGIHEIDLKTFTKNTISLLISRFGTYSSIFSFSKTYADSDLQEGVIGSSVTFVETQSRKFAAQAFDRLNKGKYILASEVVDLVTKQITNEVLAIFSKSSSIDSGALTNYCGVPLYNRVYEATKKEIKIRNDFDDAPMSTAPIYRTKECPVCFDDFDSTVKSVYLHCGHGFCTNCLRAWYHEKGNKVDCPLCRSAVYISDFANDLWPK